MKVGMDCDNTLQRNKNKMKAVGWIHTGMHGDRTAWSLFRGRFYDVL